MRVYYELTLWEEVDDYDTEKLKGKMGEMAKRFAGYGCLSFAMRGTPPAVQSAQPQQPYPNQAQPEQPEQPQQPQEQVLDE